MRPNDIRLPGAVDLSGFRRPASPPASAPGNGGPAPAGGGGAASGSVTSLVMDVTEATFERQVIALSSQVPVVIDFWAEWCGPCKQLSPILERLALASGGSWVLAKIDCDAEQRLAEAFQVQSIPSVLAVIGGQPVPLFQGALPEAQVTAVIDEVLKVAEANGVTGRVTVSDSADGADVASEPAAPARNPILVEADAALAAGDAEAALAAYRSILDIEPANLEARVSVVRAELLLRVRGVDDRAARVAAADDADDVAAALTVADLDMAHGHVEDAIGRLVDLVRRTAGDDRETLRTRLLSLFEVLDPEDPRLAKGRRALASALF
jgi:putative thioredoxin